MKVKKIIKKQEKWESKKIGKNYKWKKNTKNKKIRKIKKNGKRLWKTEKNYEKWKYGENLIKLKLTEKFTKNRKIWKKMYAAKKYLRPVAHYREVRRMKIHVPLNFTHVYFTEHKWPGILLFNCNFFCVLKDVDKALSGISFAHAHLTVCLFVCKYTRFG